MPPGSKMLRRLRREDLCKKHVVHSERSTPSGTRKQRNRNKEGELGKYAVLSPIGGLADQATESRFPSAYHGSCVIWTLSLSVHACIRSQKTFLKGRVKGPDNLQKAT